MGNKKTTLSATTKTTFRRFFGGLKKAIIPAVAILIIIVAGVYYFGAVKKEVQSQIAGFKPGVTMDQVKGEIAKQLAPINDLISRMTSNIDKRFSHIEENISSLTGSIHDLKEKSKATAAAATTQLPMGKVLELHKKAFVTEEGVNPEYWSVTFYGKNVDGKKINNPKFHEEYAKSVNENGKVAADEEFRKKVTDRNGYEFKFMVCNMNSERKARFLKNVDTILFKVNAQSHWTWDKELQAFVTSDPDGISPIIISDFNMQTKAKKQRVDKRSSTLKSKFEN